MNNSNEQPASKGLAILIKAPGVTRRFIPREGETSPSPTKTAKNSGALNTHRARVTRASSSTTSRLTSSPNASSATSVRKPGTAVLRLSPPHHRPPSEARRARSPLATHPSPLTIPPLRKPRDGASFARPARKLGRGRLAGRLYLHRGPCSAPPTLFDSHSTASESVSKTASKCVSETVRGVSETVSESSSQF